MISGPNANQYLGITNRSAKGAPRIALYTSGVCCSKKTIASYEKKEEKPPFDNPKKCGQWVLGKLKKFMSSGPVIAMVWQGNEAVGIIRKITGGTEPLASDVGTIRGDFTIDSYPLADTDNRAIRNLVHASGSPKEAKKEIEIWFKEEEILSYRLIAEEILYDVNLDMTEE